MTKDSSRRYYLHRKIKDNGGVVFARRRVVELNDQLFRFPSAILKTYLYKIKNYNYSIQSVIMATEKKKSTPAVQSIVTLEVLTDKFKYASKRMEELDQASLSLKVSSDETLVIAENNTSASHGLLKEVDAIRKTLKAPYAETVKAIDSYCNSITANLERIKLRFSTEVAKYKALKEAQLKAEAESKINEIRAVEAEKKDEADKIARIKEQLLARIYGGTFTKKDGTVVPVTGCIASNQCDILDAWIQKSVPALDTFKHYKNEYEDMLLDVGTKLAEHKLNLLDLEKQDYPSANEGAMKRIQESRAIAEVEKAESKAQFEKKIEKEIRSEVKSVNNEIDDAGKGMRSRIVYSVEDELLITRDFLSLDSTKVNAYINANKEKIESNIKEGKETVPGIKFYFETKFITR